MRGIFMAQTARYQKSRRAELVTAQVLDVQGGLFRVAVESAVFAAALAPSCLLRPRSNDTVLLAELEYGDPMILAVLARDEAAEASLRLPARCAVSCAEELALSAPALRLAGAESLDVQSRDMTVAARTASASFVGVKTLAEAAELCCRSLSTLGKTALSVFESVTQCMDSSRRMVRGEDETHAGNVSVTADENLSVMSKNSLALTEETSRTDAKLIQLG
jgi:hypothetical protein